jgi:murein DD-endopeptidase MepM/ murein hydrolase activator NlpD
VKRMKPCQLILPTLLSIPVVMPLVSSLASLATSNDATEAKLQDELRVVDSVSSSPTALWVKVRQPISIEQLSSELRIDESRLARLNHVDEDHQFVLGDWLALPSSPKPELSRLASLEAGPSSSPNDPEPTPVPSAERHGFRGQALVGSTIRMAQAAPVRIRMLLGLSPLGSGGLSWPDLPPLQPVTPGRIGGDRLGGDWIWPAHGVLSSGYGWRWGRMHKGIDVANAVGTPIVAARAGRVTASGWNDGGYGYLIEITHPDGTMSRYGHNSALMVREGEEVRQGQVISQMGSTGRSTGPHLHFEIHQAGQGASNPMEFLPPRG